MNTNDVAAAIELLMANYKTPEHPKGLNPGRLATAITEKFGDGVVSQNKIRRIVSRESREPRPSSLEPIAHFFGLTVSQLNDYDHVESVVNAGAMSEPEKALIIQEINKKLWISSLDDCIAVNKILK